MNRVKRFGARTIPPVLSTVSPTALSVAILSGAIRRGGRRDDLGRELARKFNAKAAALTDTGTSALVIALRMTCRRKREIAIPAYGCPDLISAAIRAGVTLRLYDLDPQTLNPDLSSVAAAVERGADAIIVVHFFGFPVAMNSVAELAADMGALVIEDAAQGIGGTFNGRPLGCFGSLSVLSFGRGKGVTGGAGGALLIHDDSLAMEVSEWIPSASRATSWSGLAAALGQLVMGRPELYGIPSSLKCLRLGEMVYRPAQEPREMGLGNAALAYDALQRIEAEVKERQCVAAALREIIPARGACISIPGGVSGYLRFPAVLPHHKPSPRLGIHRVYPISLGELPEARVVLGQGERVGPGASLLSRALLTLPTHRYVRESDLALFAEWARNCDRQS